MPYYAFVLFCVISGRGGQVLESLLRSSEFSIRTLESQAQTRRLIMSLLLLAFINLGTNFHVICFNSMFCTPFRLLRSTIWNTSSYIQSYLRKRFIVQSIF